MYRILIGWLNTINQKFQDFIAASFKNRVMWFFIMATVGLFVRSIYFYYYYSDWLERVWYSIGYIYLGCSYSLIVYYIWSVRGVGEIAKQYLSYFIDVDRIR